MSYYTPRTTKLESTVNKLVRLFADGQFKAGDGLPTIRRLAESLDVSVYTLHCAMAELKKKGVVEQDGGKKIFILKRVPTDEPMPERESLSEVTVSLLVGPSNLDKLNRMIIKQSYRRAFETKYPQVKINEIEVEGARWRIEEQQLGMLLEGNSLSGGEISQCSLPFYNRLGLLGTVECPETAEYIAQLPEPVRQWSRCGSEMSMLPTGWGMSFLIYNKSLLASAQMSPETAFGSFDGFHESLRRLKAHSGLSPFKIHHAYSFLQLLIHGFCNSRRRAPEERADPIPWEHESEVRKYCGRVMSMWLDEHLIDFTMIRNASRAGLDLMAGRTAITLDDGQMAYMLLSAGRGDEFGIAPVPLADSRDRMFTLCNVGGYFVNSEISEEERSAFFRYILGYMRFLHDLPAEERLPGSNALSLYGKQDLMPCRSPMAVPEGWRKAFQELGSRRLWEPIRSNWDKFLMSEVMEFIAMEASDIGVEESCRTLSGFYNWKMPDAGLELG